MECAKSELEIFSKPHYQSQIDRWMTREYSPISSLAQGTPIEFVITPVEGQMPDFSRSYLYIKAKYVVAADGADVGAAVELATVNMPLHSMFSSVDVHIGDVLVTEANVHYPYKAMIQTLLSYSDEALKSYKQCAGFYKDTASYMNNLNMAANAVNLGLKSRWDLVKGSKEFELMDRLHVDVFHTDLLLPSNLSTRIRLIPAPVNFLIMAAEDTVAYHLKILQARFFVPFKVLSNDQYMAMEMALQKANARIPFRRVTLKHLTIPAGQTTASHDNLILGKLPKRMVLAMVAETAMSGTMKENPFNFEHFGLNYLALNVNGDMVPSKPFQPNFTTGQYLREYLSLFEGMDIANSTRGLAITRDDYDNGYSLFVFDLSADQSPNSSCTDAIRTGTVRLEMRFSAATGKTINVLIISEYVAELQVDHFRNVIPYF